VTPEEMLVQIGIAGYTAWSNTLVGNQAPRTKAYYERAGKPEIGDLVVESSSLLLRLSRGSADMTQHVGILVDHKVETLTYTPQEPEEEPETYQEEAWYVRSLLAEDDAEPGRWVNATFVAIPRTPQEYAEFHGDHP
jgi:hypothetical protein